ncbi:MAG: phosphatase PAP2 family protein [Jiangellaceae bacterium]
MDTFDSIIREWARPGDVWGTAQARADYVVEGLRPAVLAGLLTLFTVAFCVIRRSLRPAIFVGGVWMLHAALAVAAKVAVGRPDPHGTVDNDGGSFPSGHTTSVIVCLGLAVLVAHPRAGRWFWLVPAFGGCLMGASLLVQAAHWSTDVVGGGLLATGVLAAASASGWPQWSRGREPAGTLRARQQPSLDRLGRWQPAEREIDYYAHVRGDQGSLVVIRRQGVRGAPVRRGWVTGGFEYGWGAP